MSTLARSASRSAQRPKAENMLPHLYSFSLRHTDSENQSKEFLVKMDELSRNHPGKMVFLTEFFPSQRNLDDFACASFRYAENNNIPVVHMDNVMAHLFFETVTGAYDQTVVLYARNLQAVEALNGIHNLLLRDTSLERSAHMLSKLNESIAANANGSIVIASGAMHADYLSEHIEAGRKISPMNTDKEIAKLLSCAKRVLGSLDPTEQDINLAKSMRMLFDEEIAPVAQEVNEKYNEVSSPLSSHAYGKISIIVEYLSSMLRGVANPFA